MTDLINAMSPRSSKSVDMVSQFEVVLSLDLSNSVHLPRIREYPFWMFSSRMLSLLT